MALGKQAKILNDTLIHVMLGAIAGRRCPLRDRVMILLSVNPSEGNSRVTGGMFMDGEGQVTSLLSLPNSASKGKKGGREVSLCPELVESLRELHAWSPRPPRSDEHVIFSERNRGRRGLIQAPLRRAWVQGL